MKSFILLLLMAVPVVAEETLVYADRGLWVGDYSITLENTTDHGALIRVVTPSKKPVSIFLKKEETIKIEGLTVGLLSFSDTDEKTKLANINASVEYEAGTESISIKESCGDMLCELFETAGNCQSDCSFSGKKEKIVPVDRSINYNGHKIYYKSRIGKIINLEIERPILGKSEDAVKIGSSLDAGGIKFTIKYILNDNSISLELEPVYNYCGNLLCEAGETFRNCPYDCEPLKRYGFVADNFLFKNHSVTFVDVKEGASTIRLVKNYTCEKDVEIGEAVVSEGVAAMLDSVEKNKSLIIVGEYLEEAGSEISLVANSIDYQLNEGFIKFLERKNTVRRDLNYEESEIVVILGGPDAPEGTGEIVEEILNESEKDFLRESGNSAIFIKNNVWKSGQTVIVLAGHNRYDTQGISLKSRESVNNMAKKDCYKKYLS